MVRTASWIPVALLSLSGASCTGTLTDDGSGAEGDRSSSIPTPPPSDDGQGNLADAGGPRADGAPSADDAGAVDASPKAGDTGTGAKADDAAPVPPDSAPTTDSAPASDDAGPTTTTGGRLVGYYANWTRTTMPPSSIPWAHLTHIAHAFVLPSATGSLRDLAAYVDSELVTTAHAHGVKVVASIGGAGASFGAMTTTAGRAALIADASTLCKTHGYDGVDIDWEFPDATTGAAWGSLIAEMRTALDKIDPALTISAAVASTDWSLKYLPTSGLASLDWIGVMTYDYAGEWSGTSGHDAPLFPSTGGDGGSVSESIDYMLKTRGLPASKVFVGLPFYGHQFGASTLNSTPVAPSGEVEYRDIAALPAAAGWAKSWDDGAKVPYLSRAASPGFLSYDDEKSIAAKCAYAKSRAVGGAIIWHLAADRLPDGSNPLLTQAQACR